MARILVLAGVNGAGKSTLLGAMLEEAEGATWYNPDEFANELVVSGHDQTDANAIAWKYGKDSLVRAIADGESYAFETTLGGNTIPGLILEACNSHEVIIWFCGLESAELHIRRVAERVAQGGHDIPEETIRGRFQTSRENLVALMPHLTQLRIFDNSAEAVDGQVEPTLVLEIERGEILFPSNQQELALTPGWAQPLLLRALELFQTPALDPRQR